MRGLDEEERDYSKLAVYELVIKAVAIQEIRESEKHVTNSSEWYFKKEGINQSVTEERTWILE